MIGSWAINNSTRTKTTEKTQARASGTYTHRFDH
jgi:hypothetical protein